ncbi:MAG: hypothetical protein HZB38_12085 [Planctomycetes bacterium]|nr:hypothetical protein [Planctomycetota bacterium]
MLRRANRAFGPIVAGLIIDALDLVTFGPVGLIVGLPIGGLAGFWMGRCLNLKPAACWLCAVLAGVYCMMPFTELLPLATIVGAYARFMEGPSPEKEAAVETPPSDTGEQQATDSEDSVSST